jgi:hypothetical protein
MNIYEANKIIQEAREGNEGGKNMSLPLWVQFGADDEVCLDGFFTIRHLQAILLVMKIKRLARRIKKLLFWRK